MTVTNTLRNKAMKIYGTKTASFDNSSEHPLPEIFASREDYDAYSDAMYDMITKEYTRARQARTKEGLPILIEIMDNLTQIREQLQGNYEDFKEDLRTYAEKALGEIKSSDLMETIRLYEGEERLNQGEGETRGSPVGKLERFTAIHQAPGFKPGETGYADEGKLKTDYGEQAEERLKNFFGCD